MRIDNRWVHRPRYRSRANDTGAGASPKMRDSPKELAAVAHEVSTHVMKSRRSSLDARSCTARRVGVFGYQRRKYFHVIEQRGFAGSCPGSIQPFEHEWPP